jgi:hypothetical protein
MLLRYAVKVLLQQWEEQRAYFMIQWKARLDVCSKWQNPNGAGR